MNVRQDYRTTDLYLSAYLKASGLPFLGTHKMSGKVYFIFEQQPNIPELKTSFFSRQGNVDALTYADELRALKSLCHS